jgi:phage/plasmid-associated DNA primase
MTMSTSKLIERTKECKKLMQEKNFDEVKQIIGEIKYYLKNNRNHLDNKKILLDATKNNIILHLPESKQESYIKTLETIISKHVYDSAYTYSDYINCKNMIRLEVIDPVFFLENINDIPLTTTFKTKYIFENGQKKFHARICYLFNVGKDADSQKLYHSVKNGETNKIFDGKCELFIETANKTNIQLLSYDQSPCEIPKFIIEHVFPKIPVDEKLKEILGRCTHKLVSDLVMLLPRENYTATIIDKNITVFYFNTTTKLYEIIKEDRIRAALQIIALDFVTSKHKKEEEEFETISKKITDTKTKINNIREKLKEMDAKNPEMKKMESEINQLETEANRLNFVREFKIESLKRFNKVLSHLENVPFMDNVTKIFITDKSILKENFADKLDRRMDVFNFKNGLVDLRTGLFRERTPDDYFTITLDYEYKHEYNKQISERIDKIILQVCNDTPKTAECYKSWLGYCMTGETAEQRALWGIGQTAQNGKSKTIEGYEQMAHIYCVKLNSKTFNENFQNKHKQLALLKLARVAYLEEIERKTMDIQAYKDYVGGKKIGGNEILYGTAESIRIYFKLIFISNKFPKFKSDAGVKRRGFCIEHTNLFYDGKNYEANKHKKGVYLKDSTLDEQFEKDEYKLAFFHLLLPYAMRYYKTKLTEVDMTPLVETWENICCENDDMARFLEENYEITENDANRIHKDDFLKHYQNYYNLNKLTWNTLINDVKRLGLEYDRMKQVNNKRGVILGLVRKDNINQPHNEYPKKDIDFLCDEDE